MRAQAISNKRWAVLPWMVVPVLFAAGCASLELPDPDVRIIALGDSTTRGPADLSYPEILIDTTEIAPEAVAFEVRGGNPSDEGLDRLREVLASDRYPNSETLLYWLGGGDVIGFIRRNDPLVITSPNEPDFPFDQRFDEFLDETQQNIEQAVELAQEAGLEVYLATYYFLRGDIQACDALLIPVLLPGQAENANDYVAALNERIRAAAANTGATLIDVATLNPLLLSSPDYYEDCNHLSDQGNAEVAELFAAALGL